jgi:hypothetical protein
VALLINGFEAGTTVGDGSNVAAATSGYSGGNAFSLVSPGTNTTPTPNNTITYSAANKIHGNYAGLFTQNGTAASLVELRDTAGSATLAARMYFNLMGNGFPSNAGSLGLQVRSTADARLFTTYLDVNGRLRINGPGSSGDVAIGTVALSSSSGSYRMETSATGVGTSSTSVTVAIYAGESTTATDTVSVSGLTTAAQTDRVRAGKVGTGTAGSFVMDSFAVNIGSATALGPFTVAASDWVRRSGGWVALTYAARRSSAWV